MQLSYRGQNNLRSTNPERAATFEELLLKDVQKFVDNEMDVEQVATLACNLDLDLAKTILDQVGVSYCDHDEMVTRYEDMLDCDGEIALAGREYFPSQLLKAVDESAYNEGFRMYADDHKNLRDSCWLGSYVWEADIDIYVNRDELNEVNLEEFREALHEEAPQLRALIEERDLERNTAPAPARYATDDWAPTPEQKTHDMGRLTQSLTQDGDEGERPVRARGMRL